MEEGQHVVKLTGSGICAFRPCRVCVCVVVCVNNQGFNVCFFFVFFLNGLLDSC